LVDLPIVEILPSGQLAQPVE